MIDFREKAITHLTCDSRKVTPESAFVCLEGLNTDGHLYARSAYDRGCRMFVCSRTLDLPDDAVQMVVDDTRVALAELSADFYGHPAEKLRIIGITGTKGKSTVAELIRTVFNAAGIRTDIIGTVGMTVGGVFEKTANSTPESLVLHEAFSRMVKAGTECVVMEVSSQAYKMHRVHGITFDIGIYTNLSEDHIGPGEHENFEEYRDCKAQLFSHSRFGIINADDAYGTYMSDRMSGKFVTYGLENGVDYCAENIELTRDAGKNGVRFTLDEKPYTLSMPGTFNVYNALAAAAASDAFGISRDITAQALSTAQVKGRFQSVDCLPGRSFIIDYSHNGLALQSALGALRAYRPKRLICLFGSVGERTIIRRREMGEVAGAMSDFCILTSDNPGREDPDSIIAEIEKYVGDCPHVCIADRAEAIRYAVQHSHPGDLVLFAGKGHEDYQLIGTEHVPFCEEQLIREAAKAVPHLV